MPRPDCKFSQSSQVLWTHASIYRKRAPASPQRSPRQETDGMPCIIAKHNHNEPAAMPSGDRTSHQQPIARNKNGAALCRYCAVLC